MLYPNVEELRQIILTAEPSFQAEFDSLLKEYVGRPTLCILQSACLKNTIQKYI
jgi:tryptophan synthase beta subunit